MNVPQLQVIDEVVKVPRSIQRQVPVIQEMQQVQKPEEVQISFKMYVDRGSECKERAYLNGRTDKAEVQKDQTSAHKCKAKWKAPRKKRRLTKRLTAADEMVRDARKARVTKRARRLHQTCRPVDPCAHV